MVEKIITTLFFLLILPLFMMAADSCGYKRGKEQMGECMIKYGRKMGLCNAYEKCHEKNPPRTVCSYTFKNKEKK